MILRETAVEECGQTARGGESPAQRRRGAKTRWHLLVIWWETTDGEYLPRASEGAGWRTARRSAGPATSHQGDVATTTPGTG